VFSISAVFQTGIGIGPPPSSSGLPNDRASRSSVSVIATLIVKVDDAPGRPMTYS
jgi:hypothetical protein